MRANTRKNRNIRNLSTFSSLRLTPLAVRPIRQPPCFLSEWARERFYEAEIRISNPSPKRHGRIDWARSLAGRTSPSRNSCWRKRRRSPVRIRAGPPICHGLVNVEVCLCCVCKQEGLLNINSRYTLKNSEKNADRSRRANTQRRGPHHRKQRLRVRRMRKSIRKTNPRQHHLRRTNPQVLRVPKMHDRSPTNTKNHPRTTVPNTSGTGKEGNDS